MPRQLADLVAHLRGLRAECRSWRDDSRTTWGPTPCALPPGRDHETWRALLISSGALTWDHPSTARWLIDEQGVDPWWAQGITVDFEQACKGRLPGQRADGTFSVSITRTMPGDRLAALATVATEVGRAHGDPHSENLAATMPVIRWPSPTAPDWRWQPSPRTPLAHRST